MTISYNKFNVFTKDLVNGVHNFTSHTVKVALSNTAPVATNTILANITQISAGAGYSTGGEALSGASVTTTTGTAKVTWSDLTITASGNMATFRYVVIYNDTPTSPVDPLICWIDLGDTVTLTNGQKFIIDFTAAGAFTVA